MGPPGARAGAGSRRRFTLDLSRQLGLSGYMFLILLASAAGLAGPQSGLAPEERVAEHRPADRLAANLPLANLPSTVLSQPDTGLVLVGESHRRRSKIRPAGPSSPARAAQRAPNARRGKGLRRSVLPAHPARG
jgi:hypothetical protein